LAFYLPAISALGVLMLGMALLVALWTLDDQAESVDEPASDSRLCADADGLSCLGLLPGRQPWSKLRDVRLDSEVCEIQIGGTVIHLRPTDELAVRLARAAQMMLEAIADGRPLARERLVPDTALSPAEAPVALNGDRGLSLTAEP
jgi:hypothetical protein